MSERYLEVSYRHGMPFAAYLFLPRRPADKGTRTERFTESLVIDFSADGRAIGIEIIHPQSSTESEINRALAHLHLDLLPNEDFAPLKAA